MDILSIPFSYLQNVFWTVLALNCTLIWSYIFREMKWISLISKFSWFWKLHTFTLLEYQRVYHINQNASFVLQYELDLIYGLSLRIKAASYFLESWVQKTGLIFYLVDFHGRNWHIPSFYENKAQHWALSSTKTNQGRFYFPWA